MTAKTKPWGLGEVPLTYDPSGPPEFVRQDGAGPSARP